MRKKFGGLIFLLFAAAQLLLPFNAVFAREVVTDWYIKDFTAMFDLKTDSTMTVTEMITADCGDLPGKHGIFRILPTRINTPEGAIPTPVNLISITDFNGNELMFEEYRDSFDNTITWKIGDPDRTVKGENFYKIIYEYKNVVRAGNPEFDEFYWNLNGNFWDIEADKFSGTIIFPAGVTQENSEIFYYTGAVGGKESSQAVYEWTDEGHLQFDSTRTLAAGEGITVSVAFPKDIFTPYQLSFWDMYGWIVSYLFALIVPIGGMFTFFIFWLKYGREIKINKAAMPEYSAPDNLSPMVSKMLMTAGAWKKEIISAGIISLATKGIITIEELKTGLWKNKDFEFKKIGSKEAIAKLDAADTKLLNSLFGKGNEIKLSSLATTFSSARDKIKEEIMKILLEKELITKEGVEMQKKFVLAGIIMSLCAIMIPFIATMFMNIPDGSIFFMLLIFASFSSGFVIILMSQYMIKRTPKGAEAAWHLNNLKMFMKTAEIDRQKFYEEQNIFEKYLPYAMIFGITGLWVKRMKDLYGEEYFNNYHPAWYHGAGITAFSAGSFTSAMNSLSTNISSHIGSTSGSGGGGSSGGGGGGGGGGGW